MMAGLVFALYGAGAYILFLLTFLYAIGFVGNLPMLPNTIDTGDGAVSLAALAIDMGLLGIFAVQHSVMARPAFKRWWTRFVPPAVERATYVLFASSALILLFWQWRAMPVAIWDVQSPVAALALQVVSGLGWG